MKPCTLRDQVHYEFAQNWYNVDKLRRSFRVSSTGQPQLFYFTVIDFTTRSYCVDLSEREAEEVQNRIRYLEVMKLLNPDKFTFKRSDP